MTTGNRALRAYIIGTCIVWAGIFLAVAVMLPEHFAQLLPILAGPMVWFVILVPPLLRDRHNGLPRAASGEDSRTGLGGKA